jgi:transcription elongation factor GreA
MNHSAISDARKHLVEQLSFLDENYSTFCNTYLHQLERERPLFEKQLQVYRKTIEMIINQSDDEFTSSLQNISLIGSKIDILFVEDGFVDSFTIVYPTEIDPDNNRISILSPIGSQLLLSSLGDCLTLETPVMKQEVIVEGIQLSYLDGFNKNTI